MTVHVFEYDVGGHYWAAILDLNISRWFQNTVKIILLDLEIPNLVGKVDNLFVNPAWNYVLFYKGKP